ncbi:hypothetical protein HRG_001105 [Hirsutella rhossiliensis]|uniref:Serine/threonine protein kinase n=1 Tax=Hirsutella rhossiliensis TaxID=111463 RepID=A0A9P8SMD5_9HYPO|nr:putative serine/threonine protein kinase [Hirsutella rhossiliensis]KAH0968463.1 putative serine/threonine protein kinase [Hirsutella rhossiliensis]
MAPKTGHVFSELVVRLRANYQDKRQRFNVFPPAGQPTLDTEFVHGERPYMGIWYDHGAGLGRYVRLFDIPATLSGRIPRLERHFEIDGGILRNLQECPDLPQPIPDDFEDIGHLVKQPPLLQVDTSKHLKRIKYKSEIENILKCQGGSCPGQVLSAHLVRLLGISSDGLLVFEKLATRGPILARFSSLRTYKRWILHIIDALACLHSHGIVHRDLRIDNFCDLESRWGQRAAPEISFNGGLDSGWTVRSDIYDIGNCIKCMVYANAPIINQVEWPVPEPLQAVVNVCMREASHERPTLFELQQMVEAIPIGEE